MLPSKEMMDNFSSRIKDIYSMIDNLASCNLNLTKQRDSLLPRLMSGKISLEGKEII